MKANTGIIEPAMRLAMVPTSRYFHSGLLYCHSYANPGGFSAAAFPFFCWNGSFPLPFADGARTFLEEA